MTVCSNRGCETPAAVWVDLGQFVVGREPMSPDCLEHAKRDIENSVGGHILSTISDAVFNGDVILIVDKTPSAPTPFTTIQGSMSVSYDMHTADQTRQWH